MLTPTANVKKKYFFICDDIIELQMFQGYQNWSWLSQGVLGSNFIAVPGNPGGRAIQLYMYNIHPCISYVYVVSANAKGPSPKLKVQ